MDGKSESSPGAEIPPPDNKSAPTSVKELSPSKAKAPRRRTKTGCLTCRKRRIKCGEEKPICKNCIKSRRDCLGYGQRVIFRPPVGPLPHIGPMTPMPSFLGAMPSTLIPHHPTYPFFPEGADGARQSYLPLAPRPHPHDGTGAIFSQPIPTPFQMQTEFSPEYPQPGNVSPLDQFPGNMNQPRIYTGPTADGKPKSTNYSNISTNWEQHGDTTDALAHVRNQGAPFGQNSDTYHMPPEQSPEASGFPNFVSNDYRNAAVFMGNNATHLNNNRPSATYPNHDYVVEDDEDYDYDFESGDEQDTEENSLAHYEPRKWAMAVPFTAHQETQAFATFVSYNNLLTTYRPSPFTSPLLDPEAAQIFSHYITTVGPMLSVFEACPPVPSLMTSGCFVPPEARNLWTYTLPSLALEHPALMHALLATSSLHLAGMTGQTPTASFRHYHYALRRIRKAVGLPHRRNQIATLAATLVLGFYEVMGADHSKWCSHVAGGSQLIQETNFAGLTKILRGAKARANAEQAYMTGRGSSDDDDQRDLRSEVDEGLISVIMGRPVNYDDFRHVSRGLRDYQPKLDVTEKEVDEYRVRTNLYWWYCKHDMYQSLISGNRLLMPYHRWGECPPRARIGDLDAAHGTFDHLVLLLARITEYGAKDRERKLREIAANGGVWRPPPGLFQQSPPQGPQDRPMQRPPPSGPNLQPPNNPNRETSPPMYGMAPSTPVQLPPGFNETRNAFPSPESAHSDTQQDLDALAAESLSEWEDMLAACNEFENALGPGFQPLPPGAAPVITTPFGPAIQYRTHTVACIWACYYLGRILLRRVHPSMPPAAMMAAGVSAAQTAQDAQLIGRIVAGVYGPQYPSPPVDPSPSVAGILVELLIPVFYAAVQYTDGAQRNWTIALLRDITRLTGGKSSASVAGGCETAWIKAHEAGRGPPYKPVEDMPDVERRYAIISLVGTGTDRQFVMVSQTESMDFAMGLLSIDGFYPSAGKNRVIEEV